MNSYDHHDGDIDDDDHHDHDHDHVGDVGDDEASLVKPDDYIVTDLFDKAYR